MMDARFKKCHSQDCMYFFSKKVFPQLAQFYLYCNVFGLMGQWGSELLERVKRVCIILKLGVAELHLPTVNHFKPAFVTLWFQCIIFNNINKIGCALQSNHHNCWLLSRNLSFDLMCRRTVETLQHLQIQSQLRGKGLGRPQKLQKWVTIFHER